MSAGRLTRRGRRVAMAGFVLAVLGVAALFDVFAVLTVTP